MMMTGDWGGGRGRVTDVDGWMGGRMETMVTGGVLKFYSHI